MRPKKASKYRLPLAFVLTFCAGAGFGMYLFLLTKPVRIACMFMLPNAPPF